MQKTAQRETHALRLPGLAEELVLPNVDLIVAWFTPAALAARQATHLIPIVMALVGNPVETGLVASLAQPDGNVTGMAAIGAELAGKLVDVVHELMPAARRIAALANVPDPFSKPFLHRIDTSVAAAGITIDPIMIHSSAELDAVFSALGKKRSDALIVQQSLPIRRVAELALRYSGASGVLHSGFHRPGWPAELWDRSTSIRS